MLIGMVSEPDECFFYSQLLAIRDHFTEVPLDDTLDYVRQLEEVLNYEKSQDAADLQILSQVRKVKKAIKRAKAGGQGANATAGAKKSPSLNLEDGEQLHQMRVEFKHHNQKVSPLSPVQRPSDIQALE